MKPYYTDDYITIYCANSNNLSGLVTNSDMIITSPPYNVGKEYEAGITRDEYIEHVNHWTQEWHKILSVPGRFCVNIAQTMGNHNEIFSPLNIWLNAMQSVDLKLRDIIIWNQINSGSDTAWGSFAKATSPWLRHQTESVIVGYKDEWVKKGGVSTIDHLEFSNWTRDIWDIPTARHKLHPAVYPEELVRRCIRLFTFKSDLILDPFLGTGTTAWVAKTQGRNCIGFEIREDYCEIAAIRCSQHLLEI
jgi:site-specific DNA-methyltransferase (adenine-specific)